MTDASIPAIAPLQHPTKPKKPAHATAENYAIRKTQASYKMNWSIDKIKEMVPDEEDPKTAEIVRDSFDLTFLSTAHPGMQEAVWKALKDRMGWTATQFKARKEYYRGKFDNAMYPDAVDMAEDTLSDLLKHCVFIEEGSRVADMRKRAEYRVSSLRDFLAASRRHARGTSAKAIGEQWMDKSNRRTAQGVRFEPEKGDVFEADGATWVNAYAIPDMLPVAQTDMAIIEPFTTHMDFLFPKKDVLWRFLCWLAYGVQHPGERIKFAPMLIAVNQGMGRGWLTALLQALHGWKNVGMAGMKELNGDWSDYHYQKTIVVIEEGRETGRSRFTLMDSLNDKIEAPVLPVNIKGGANMSARAFANFIFFTNHPDAFCISENDRRLWVISTPGAFQDEEYYIRIYAALKDPEFIAHVYHFLNTFPLDGFNAKGRAPETPEKDRMVDANISPTRRALNGLMKEKLLPRLFTDATLTQLVQARIHEDMGEDALSYDNTRVNNGDLGRMKQNRFHKVYGGKQVWIDGKGMRLWTREDNPSLTAVSKEVVERVHWAWYFMTLANKFPTS